MRGQGAASDLQVPEDNYDRHQMHKSPFRKLKKRLFGKSRKLTLAQTAIMMIVAYGAFKIITMAASKF